MDVGLYVIPSWTRWNRVLPSSCGATLGRRCPTVVKGAQISFERARAITTQPQDVAVRWQHGKQELRVCVQVIANPATTQDAAFA